MKQLFAVLSLIGILIESGAVYPQAMKVHSVDGESGNYTVTIQSADGHLYGIDGVSGDIEPDEIVAVVMYDNGSANDPTDDIVIAMRRTGLPKGA